MSDLEAYSFLSTSNSIGILSNTTVLCTAPLLEALGESVLAAVDRATNVDGVDSRINFNFSSFNITRPIDPNSTSYDLKTIAWHEIDEALGIGGNASGLYAGETFDTASTNGVGPLDFYRYSTNGVRSYRPSSSINPEPYFSIDGGATPLVHFNQYGGGTDYGDWGNGIVPPVGDGNDPPQVQDAFGTPGATADLGANELIALDVAGYTLRGTSSIQAVTLVNTMVNFTVNTLPGQSYAVQATTSLASPSWQNTGPPVNATGTTMTFSDPTATGSQRFYRVVSTTPKQPQAQALLNARIDRTPLRADQVGKPVISVHRIGPRQAGVPAGPRSAQLPAER